MHWLEFQVCFAQGRQHEPEFSPVAINQDSGDFFHAVRLADQHLGYDLLYQPDASGRHATSVGGAAIRNNNAGRPMD